MMSVRSVVPMVLMLLASIVGVLGEEAEPVITVRHVRRLESPFPDGGGGGNSHLLPGMPPDGPRFAVSWSKGYEDCTAAFYDAGLEMIARWREPVAGGDKVMAVTAGDLDDDGSCEILLTVRKQAPGAYALRWNEDAGTLETVWSFLDVPRGPYYRGIAVGNFTDHPGREVCFGGDGTGLFLLDSGGALIAYSDRPAKTIQYIDVCDDDGDGYDEMLVCTGRGPGEVYYLKWHPTTHTLQTLWRADVTPHGRGGNNCYEAHYHPNGHPNGGPAIAVNTEQEAPPEARAGSILMLDMDGRELWHYVYGPEEERGGACDFADVTGDGVPEILSRYSRRGHEGRGELGVLILDNRGHRLARIPGVTAGSAGPYVFRPDGPGAGPVYLLATTNVYEIVAEPSSPE